jgi:hypothetical protein
VCEEINNLKCRGEFVWYKAKTGCPYYVESVPNNSGKIIDQIIADILDGIQYEMGEEDKMSDRDWEQSDLTGYHVHRYAYDKFDTLSIALALSKAKYMERYTGVTNEGPADERN